MTPCEPCVTVQWCHAAGGCLAERAPDEAPHSCGQCECCEAWRNKVQILTALLPTCGTCRHADADSAPDASFRCCTSKASWFLGRVMPKAEGCTKWERLEDDDDGA
jgi:hypothetical protein